MAKKPDVRMTIRMRPELHGAMRKAAWKAQVTVAQMIREVLTGAFLGVK
jgi:predicted HicB family RNase H-like nuclease